MKPTYRQIVDVLTLWCHMVAQNHSEIVPVHDSTHFDPNMRTIPYFPGTNMTAMSIVSPPLFLLNFNWKGVMHDTKFHSSSLIIYSLTARVVGAPHMIPQTVCSIFPFSSALWDLANSRPVHSLMLSSHLFLSLRCLHPSFTVPCKMVLARPDEWETCPYHCSLHRFAMVRRSLCSPVACWFLAWTS